MTKDLAGCIHGLSKYVGIDSSAALRTAEHWSGVLSEVMMSVSKGFQVLIKND